jgi:hypothetical protein
MITEKQVLNALTSYKLKMNSSITTIVIKDFKVVNTTDPLKYLSKALTRHNYVIIKGEGEGEDYVCDHKALLNNFLKNDKL